MNFMARESGVDAFLRKPEDTELLVRTIATLREDCAQMGRVARRDPGLHSFKELLSFLLLRTH